MSPRRGNRDRELLGFVGRHGIVSIEHVRAQLRVGRTAAYRRVAACIEAGLLERLDLLRSEPSLLRATRAGLRYAGLGLPLAIVSPGAVDHWLRCASTAQLLAGEFGPAHLISERELVLLERIEGRPLASARLGQLPSGAPRLHRPDLVILPSSFSSDSSPSASDWGRAWPSSSRTQGEESRECTDVHDRALRTEDKEIRSATHANQPIAVEVELTPKSPRRLEAILRAWRRADWVAEVHYHCAPGPTRRAVERALARTHAEAKVRVRAAVPR